MKKISVRKIFLFLIINALNIYGQGIIKGTVTDSLSLEQLKGTEIILTGTNFNTVSNTDGEFYLTEIPAGEYVLQASYFGYKEKKYLVNVKSEETLSLDVVLLPNITNGNDMVLTDQVKSQAEEINLENKASIIKNVISGKKLQYMPEENIPIALSRLPGVSVLYKPFVPISSIPSTNDPFFNSLISDGFPIHDDPVSRILIRGLDSKFANITIDGIRIPTTSLKDKSTDLNIFRGKYLYNIELNKTIGSDEDADATAGSINLITGKAPDKRMIKAELLGNYNKLDNSKNQYNFAGNYGERFFNNLLGVQVDANAEKRIISSEYQKEDNLSTFSSVIVNSVSYRTLTTYFPGNISYTNAIRERYGANILLDFSTPDGGSIRFNNIFSKISTEYFSSEADSNTMVKKTSSSGSDSPSVHSFSYPTDHIFNDLKTERQVFLSSIEGNNYLLGFNVDWNAAFSESKNNNPFNFTIYSPGVFTSEEKAYVDYSQYNPSKNYGKEKTVSINIYKKYDISNEFSGKIKFGAKYRIISKLYDEHLYEERIPYYNQYIKLADGSLVRKDFSGTRFEGLVGIFSNNLFLSYFQDNPPGVRSLFDNYEIPLVSKDALHLWRQLNYSPYYLDNDADINSYSFTGSVSAGYVIHELNFGQSAIFITGLRIESEKNNYNGYYLDQFLPNKDFFYNGISQQTDMHHYNKTTILPNFRMILKPADFLNLRLAVYKTLIRPDYNARAPKYFKVSYLVSGRSSPYYWLIMGNPYLENADVWNYEFQTQFYGNDIGQFSINAFYKDIKGMQQATNGIQISGSNQIDTLGIHLSSFPFNDQFQVFGKSTVNFYSYYNSPEPTRIWGFEIEHRANFRYLPGLLKNITLNYNLTFLRSETWTFENKTIVASTVQNIIENEKHKISDMPEFFANVILGYDIYGFAFRISYFYQDEYPEPFNYNNYKFKKNKISRLDIAARQQILENISVYINLNNITNSKEEYSYWMDPGVPNQTYQAYGYGMNFDFGVRVDL